MSVLAAAFSSSNRLSALVFTALLSLSATVQAAPPATPVFVQMVERLPFVQTVEALGTLRANESVTLSAKVTDTISAIHFDDGDRVEAGQVLVEMTDAEEQARLTEAQSALEEAERQFERVRTLMKSNLSTESVLDERRRAYRIAQAQLEQVKSQLKDHLVIAPFAGVVGLRNISVGTLVRPGDTITTLDDDSVMKLDMSVPSIYLDILRPGLQVEAKARALSDTTFTGEITGVASRVDPITRSVVVRARIPNQERILRPGLLMTVDLQKPARDALVIAEEAVIQRGDSAHVYVVDNSVSPAKAVQRQVTLGVRKPGVVEVTSGLETGEQVVIHGTLKLRPGSDIQVAATATGGESLRELLRKAAANQSATAVN